MTKLNLPLACDMTALQPAQRSTHGDVLQTLIQECIEVAEQGEAIALRYPARPELLRAAGEWIGLERECCGFLSFELSAPSGDETFTLRIGDGAEVKAFVRQNFPSVAEAAD